MNLQLAYHVIEALLRLGVRDFCLCPGRRNAPFVSVLEFLAKEHSDIAVHCFFEERSAAFFALGLMANHRDHGQPRPVAVCTTSGTACAELLPAAVECFYSGHPLVLLTSDRPRRLRGSGAPQTIDQVGLYGSYVSECLDVACEADLPSPLPLRDRPIQLNVCFDEPLPDLDPTEFLKEREDLLRGILSAAPVSKDRVSAEDSTSRDKLTRFLSQAKSLLVVAGPLCRADREAVEKFLLALGAPVYAEAASQLRGSAKLEHLLVSAGNSFIKGLLDRGRVDAVLRIGGVPAPRIWRDLDEQFKSVRVCSLSENMFVGLGRGDLIQANLREFLPATVVPHPLQDRAAVEVVMASDRQERARLDGLLEAFPRSEVSLIRALGKEISKDARVYLGNSLPIREWDLACDEGGNDRHFAVNRGANGIDGQLSTFFGWRARREEASQDSWAIVGDLTALYDLSGPWALRKDSGLGKIRLVVINNGGGQIFSRMFASPLFVNQHELSFEGWAAMWGLSYQSWNGTSALHHEEPKLVLEVKPDPIETKNFWKEYESGVRR